VFRVKFKFVSTHFWLDWIILSQAGLARWIESDSVEESVKKLDIRSLLNYYIRGAAEMERSKEFAVKAKEYSARLERSDPSSLRIWSNIRGKTVDHLTSAWEEFGIKFDIIQVSNFVMTNWKMPFRILRFRLPRPFSAGRVRIRNQQWVHVKGTGNIEGEWIPDLWPWWMRLWISPFYPQRRGNSESAIGQSWREFTLLAPGCCCCYSPIR